MLRVKRPPAHIPVFLGALKVCIDFSAVVHSIPPLPPSLPNFLSPCVYPSSGLIHLLLLVVLFVACHKLGSIPQPAFTLAIAASLVKWTSLRSSHIWSYSDSRHCA